MNVQELLVQKDGEYKPSGVWYCGECRVVYGCKNGGLDAAKDCCLPRMCEHCGGEIGEKYWTACKSCRDAREKKKEQEKFDRAIKVLAAEYQNPVMTGYDDWHQTVDELLDSLEDWDEEEDGPKPTYAWGSTIIKARFDADDVIERLADNGFEDYADQVVDADELQEFLEKWCAKQPDSWEVDYRTVVILP